MADFISVIYVIRKTVDRKILKVYKDFMPNRIVHFEIEAKDKERAKKFYSKAFNWEMQQMGKDFSDYVVVVTGDPKEPTGINGGLYQMMGRKKEVNAYRCVISVDNIEKAMKDVKAAGGKVYNKKPDNIPGVGLYAKCEDTEGNFFGILEPAPMEPKK